MITIKSFVPAQTHKKVVNFHGVLIEIEPYAYINYISVDADGKLVGHENHPEISSFHDWITNDGYSIILGQLEFEGDWKESLLEV